MMHEIALHGHATWTSARVVVLDMSCVQSHIMSMHAIVSSLVLFVHVHVYVLFV